MHPDPEASYFHRNSTLTLALSPSTPIFKISSPMYCVVEQPGLPAHGFKQGLLSIWYDYLDTTARDNALAPPRPVATLPPGGTE
jgi:hypothetical protein